MSNSKISKSFSDSLKPEFLQDLLENYSEMGIDSIIDDPILKEIPIVKWLIASVKVGKNIRDAFNIRKLAKFLYQLKDVSDDERTQFYEKLEQENHNKQKLSEQLMILIDRHEDETKSIFLANAFLAFIKKEIEYYEFQKFTSIIDQVSIWDLLIAQRRLTRTNARNEDSEFDNAFREVNFRKLLTPYGIYKEVISEKSDNNLTQHGRQNKKEYNFRYESTLMGRKFLSCVLKVESPY